MRKSVSFIALISRFDSLDATHTTERDRETEREETRNQFQIFFWCMIKDVIAATIHSMHLK